MGLLVMTNPHLGITCLETDGTFNFTCKRKPFPSCGLLSSPCPFFGTKNAKKSRIYVLRKLRCGKIYALMKEDSAKRLVGGEVLEKELEFKPSFSEYLEAMESVKTAHKSNRYNWKDDSRGNYRSRTPSVARDDENVELSNFERYTDEEMISSAESEGTVKDKFDRKRNVIRKSVDKFSGQEGCADAKVKREHRGGMVKDKFDQRRSVTRKSMDKFSAEEGGGDAKFKREPRGETPKGIWLPYKDKEEPELKDSHFDKGNRFQKAQGGPVVFAGDRSSSRIAVRGKPVCDNNSSKMFGTKGKSFEREKVGVISRGKRDGTIERSLVQVEKANNNEVELKSGKLISSSKSFPVKGGDSSWEVERAAFNTFEEDNDLLNKPRVSKMEMEERIQNLARRLNGADIDVPEWMFSKMMRSARIRFSDHSILRVIQIVGKLGNWRRVLQVIEWLQMRERFKSHRLRFIYTAAINVLGKARRPVEALNVFQVMQQQISSYPDIVAYRCIAVTLGQAGHIKELFDVIDSMKSPPKKKFKTGLLEKWDPRLEPDIVIYNAVLNACVRRKQCEGAFWVLQQLKQQDQKPSATTYGLVMEVMFACGKYNLVHEFFRKLQKSFFPNALAYKVLLNTLWREGKIDEAVLAVQDMERQGIVGSAALYYDLARCLCSTGRCQEALMQMEKICKVANKPLVVTYTGLIQACLNSGNIQDAAGIFIQMKDFCSPNLVTCNIMLKAYLEHGWFEEAKKLFQKMSDDSNYIFSGSDNKDVVIPDIYTFNTMLAACTAEKRWDDLDFVYTKMLHHGYYFNGKRHLRMILDASRAGKVELLETTWKHLAETQRTPPLPLIKERFCIKLENKDYVSALSCITSHAVSDWPEFSETEWFNLFKRNSRRFGEDALVRLLHEASIITKRSSPPNSALMNLISSCKEFLQSHTTVPAMNLRDTLSAVLSESVMT